MKPFKIFLAILFLGMVMGCSNAGHHKVLKLAHGLDPTHPVHKGMVFMAQRLAEKSKGELTIDIYPSGQLGSEQQCVELLQIGSLAITKVSAAVMESFTPKFKVLGLPYIFRSKEHSFNVFDGEIGKELLLGTQEYWIRGLCFYDAGFRSFYTIDKPINTPEDLNGMKIRVMKSQSAMEMVKALGGSPTPISWGELYTALQSGVVDGAENNPPSLYTSHHYEVCKEYSLDEHTCVPDVLIISTKVWNSLTEQEQKWLQEAADESVPVERKYWAESVEESLRVVQEAGVKINYPDKKLFADKVKGLLDKYKKDEVLGDLIRRIEAVED
ncbi:TRAP transporter substrate-binding protein [Maribellus sp. YY47]|uniref:TRAP transporter substrate-binding protein n=1 Tax=Maribellus sp. YY47 TaxID=2929486 RepID=UPI002001BE3C|nr:TRAP transporter substrate-binding protein [Maribellus sp. YY47]MCK3684153.1 TRAP transporter substrate-binding protein [Maribellus sp. YY47]